MSRIAVVSRGAMAFYNTSLEQRRAVVVFATWILSSILVCDAGHLIGAFKPAPLYTSQRLVKR